MSPKASHALVALVSAAAGVLATVAVVRPGSNPDAAPSPPTAPITLVLDEAASARLGARRGEVDLADPVLTLRQLRGLGEELALSDPAAALERAASIPGHDNKEAFFSEVLRVWGERDGEAAIAWARENLEGELFADALYYIADGWAESDPQGSAEWFLANSEGPVLEDALWEAMEAWGRKDPAAALAWSQQLDEDLKWMVLDGLADGWGAVDPAAAAAAGLALVESDQGYGYDFLVATASQWGAYDPRAAAAWSDSILNERVRAGFVGELADSWARSDPEAAAAWASSMADAGSRRFAEEGVALGWSKHDPGGAMAWAVEAVEDSGHLDEMITDIAFQWSQYDPRGAVSWLESRDRGPVKDRVLKHFSSAILDEDPEAALAWAAEIADPPSREAQLRLLLGEWVGYDGEAARARLAELDLPPGLKREFGVQ